MKHTLTSIKDTESGTVDINYRPVYLEYINDIKNNRLLVKP